MRKIPKKNYILLVLMILGVVVITFAGRSFYNNNLRNTSEMYKYAIHMNSKDLKEYLFESPSLVIYVADKYNTNNEILESKLKKKIISNNLYNNFVYVDYREFNKNFINYFNSTYNTNLRVDKLPTIIIYEDGSVGNIFYSIDDTNMGEINLDVVK